jgi:arylsulfatase
MHDAKAPPRFEIKAPVGSPNVVIVLLDDIGFGQSGAFGGPCNMPTLDRLAANGLRYNAFHTTALCSPTRTALLTGRNHHVNNAGAIMELATAFPGNTGIRPNDVTPLAEMLRLNGFSTAAFGKYHETPPWEVSVSGPYDRWPTHSGFDKFYGFIGGETNQWGPAIFDGTVRVEPPHDPNYHFTTDMTNQAIGWMQAQHSLTPDRPFYVFSRPAHPRAASSRKNTSTNTKASLTGTKRGNLARQRQGNHPTKCSSLRDPKKFLLGFTKLPTRKLGARRWKPCRLYEHTDQRGRQIMLMRWAQWTTHCSFTSWAITPAPKAAPKELQRDDGVKRHH